ncbi:MAG: hypothetical protein REI64_03145 [Pedobacter sp.]|uniref:hypothetical protein n=1 Tax=Pedobacter sp. TaxID=1411316 RepID=UPI00280838B8|nr:hypothetical protein [Pedobacter sp.]MDQ8003768.1 hypothetical protein [Pedobacter sp.]
MEKFKNSTYIAFYAATVTSLVGFIVFSIFVYPKDPLTMPDTMIGLLTIIPFVVFFIITLVTVPMVVIPIKKHNFIQNKPALKGVYEVSLYIFLCTLLVMMFDFAYQFITRNEFSKKFAKALKLVLSHTQSELSNKDYDSFSKWPFLVQNMFTFIMGMLIAGVIAYPISIAVAKKISNKTNDYGKY